MTAQQPGNDFNDSISISKPTGIKAPFSDRKISHLERYSQLKRNPDFSVRVPFFIELGSRCWLFSLPILN